MDAISYNGTPFEKAIQSFQCELVSELPGDATVRGSLERIRQSQYEISYQTTIRGRHQLHIKVEDQHFKGSPFPVAVKLPIEKLGTPIIIPTIYGMMGPRGITFNQRGEVVVTERDGGCVTFQRRKAPIFWHTWFWSGTISISLWCYSGW